MKRSSPYHIPYITWFDLHHWNRIQSAAFAREEALETFLECPLQPLQATFASSSLISNQPFLCLSLSRIARGTSTKQSIQGRAIFATGVVSPFTFFFNYFFSFFTKTDSIF